MNNIDRYRYLSNTILIVLINFLTINRLMEEVNIIDIILVILSVSLAFLYILSSNNIKYKVVREIIPICAVFIFNMTLLLDQINQNTLMVVLLVVVNVILVILIIYMVYVNTRKKKKKSKNPL